MLLKSTEKTPSIKLKAEITPKMIAQKLKIIRTQKAVLYFFILQNNLNIQFFIPHNMINFNKLLVYNI